ncbi:MAG: hypothetical protein M1823_001616 [Watsoniomyces obsoletus]|nr:MAG: hypothetical protein M1823_001616 [Watsoniomyces obsoletus]
MSISMSSISSSHASLSSSEEQQQRNATSRSSSFYLPTALAQTASSFLRRFYTEPPATDHSLSSSTARSRSSSFDVHHQSQYQSQTYANTTSSSTLAPSSTSTIHSIDGTYTPPPYRRASPFQPPPLHPLTLRGLKPSPPGQPPTQLLTRTLAEEIRLLVPPRLQLLDEWTLAYSLERDGVSLGTLYNKCEPWRESSRRGGFVVVVKDGGGGIFGAYLSDPPYPSPHYYGTGECFLWRSSVLSYTPSLLSSALPLPPSADTTNMTRSTTIANTNDPVMTRHSPNPPSSWNDDEKMRQSGLSPPPLVSVEANGNGMGNENKPRNRSDTNTSTPEPIRFKAFPYSGMNDYLIFCQQGFLSVGGGDGKYGLWLDDVFEKGISAPCPTFGNEGLSDDGMKFDVLGVEVWAVRNP